MRYAVLLALLAACSGSPHEASCGGAQVGLCRAFEHVAVRSAAVMPNELVIADFSMMAHIRVQMDVCPRAPSAAEVQMFAVIPRGTEDMDGGTDVRVMSLLTLHDGADGDPTPGDGIIDVNVANPFIATVPPRTDLSLRFVGRAGAAGCVSDGLEIPYRTGAMRP
jgi:hypothetical protein